MCFWTEHFTCSQAKHRPATGKRCLDDKWFAGGLIFAPHWSESQDGGELTNKRTVRAIMPGLGLSKVISANQRPGPTPAWVHGTGQQTK